MNETFNCGHSRDPENTANKAGRVTCRECKNRKQREKRARERSQAPETPIFELLGKRPERIVPSRVISQEW